jgi:bifunctional oligoribonuclease and PAP phosphatase NrnA
MIHTDPAVAAPAITAALEEAQRVLVLSHVSPDGDAIGSLLAMWHMLHAQGKVAMALASSPMPSFVKFLPGIEHVQVYDRGMALPAFDLAVLVDASTLERTGPIYEDYATVLTSQPLVIVDHHVTTVGEGKVNLIQPRSASCAELVYQLMQALDVPITPPIATCLLLGVTTDTQSFQTSATGATSLRVAADLVELGANHQAVVRSVYYETPYSTLRLQGAALSHIQREGALAWTWVSQEMMRQTGADDGANDELVHVLQRVTGVRICALFKERQNGETKLSLRSTPGIDVAAIARTWGGGGHSQAAGATLRCSLAQAQAEVLPLLLQRLQEEA